MFLGGADGDQPEFRVASIKGALRFWWRAFNGHLSLAQLHETEGLIFGGTEGQSGRSKFSIQLIAQDSYRSIAIPMLPHRERSFTKLAIPIGTNFTIRLAMRGDVSDGTRAIWNLDQLKHLFILTATLGGLGKRSRRGFGSFSIQSINKESFSMPDTLEAIYRYVASISPHFQLSASNIYFSSKRSAAYPYIRLIELGKSSYAVDALLHRISQTTHDVKKQDTTYSYNASLGHADGGRFASPIYTSLVDGLAAIRIVITSLNTVPDRNRNKVSLQLQDTFKKKLRE